MPIATLKEMPKVPLCVGMSGEFRKAFLWHMERHETSITDLVRGSGVSRDVINKIKARETASTSVENAVAISAYFGKTVEEFIRCDDSEDVRPLAALSELLTDDEVRMLESQVRGLLASREPR